MMGKEKGGLDEVWVQPVQDIDELFCLLNS